MKTVYLALPLMHVNKESERDEIRHLIRWFKETFDVEVLKWAFNTDTWTPGPVENIFDYDTEKVLRADLVIVFYPESGGSDGRGGEVVLRVQTGKPILAFKKRGVKVSRYPTDCLKNYGVTIEEYDKFEDIEKTVRKKLLAIS